MREMGRGEEGVGKEGERREMGRRWREDTKAFDIGIGCQCVNSSIVFGLLFPSQLKTKDN